jgi:putative toxin-antitoxin system antitoxin component (TIGR02293 family)
MVEEQGPNPPEPAQIGPPDKWLHVLSITARAGEVFANRDKALEWLQTPSPALRDATPLNAIETESGCQEVEDILGRIEYGVLG